MSTPCKKCIEECEWYLFDGLYYRNLKFFEDMITNHDGKWQTKWHYCPNCGKKTKDEK